MICYNRLGDTSDETLIDIKLDNNDDIIIIGKIDGFILDLTYLKLKHITAVTIFKKYLFLN